MSPKLQVYFYPPPKNDIIVLPCLGVSQVAQMVKNLPASAGDTGSIPRLGRSAGEGNGNPFQYSFLGNSMDRGAWWAKVHGATKSRI